LVQIPFFPVSLEGITGNLQSLRKPYSDHYTKFKLLKSRINLGDKKTGTLPNKNRLRNIFREILMYYRYKTAVVRVVEVGKKLFF
jgi:hypothetical protein